jgi:hypothetical protein
MAVQVVRLDLLLILLVAASYEFEWLVPIPFLMRRLVCGLTDASSVPATVASLAGLSFLPPFATPLLFRICGGSVLPTALAACGSELSRMFTSPRKSD